MNNVLLGVLLASAGHAAAKDKPVTVAFYVPDADISTSTLANARDVAANGEPKDRRKAMDFFAWQARKYAEYASREILAGLDDPDPSVRTQAAVAFRNLKALSKAEVDRHLEGLWKRDRFAAAIASAYREISNEAIARELLAGLKRPQPFQDDAAGAFKILGSSAAAIVRQDLLSLIDSSDQELSCTALMVLADTRTAPPEVVPRMRRWIRQGRYCDWQAAAVLGAIGPPAAEAIPELVGRIRGQAGECCSWDSQYLVSIGTASVPALLGVAKERDPYRRAWSLFALAQLADKDDRAATAAIKGLDDSEREPRVRAQHGFEMIGARTRALARPLFQRMLRFEKLWLSDNSRYETWPGDALKLLIPAFPTESEELFAGLPTSGLQLDIRKATGTSASNTTALELIITNTTERPLQIAETSCSVGLSDPVELIVFMEPGWLILRRPSRWHSEPRPRNVLSLMPGASQVASCTLQEKVSDNERKRMFLPEPWSFDYRTVGLGDSSPTLRPGRYKVWAHYRLRGRLAKALSNASGRVGSMELWEGDAYSEPLELEVK